jgi:alpha-D-xyloside xylohydrolase
MGRLYREEEYLVWQDEHLHVWLSAVGDGAVRVQANLAGKRFDLPQALLDPGPKSAVITIERSVGHIETGELCAEVLANGKIRFTNQSTGTLLLEQPDPFYYKPANLEFKHREGNLYQVTTLFQAQVDEKFYGLGQHQHGMLNQKGCVIDLQQRNTEIAIPFVVSSRKYGFLWNNPAIGRVELGSNTTRWVASGTQQLDYVVFAGEDYARVLQRYAGATGFPARLPDWVLGFWQCKLRYETQDALLAVAREYKRRGLPLSVIVSDFFNWSRMGDWRFDPECWPDPAKMTAELEEMGVRLMVSIWPTVSPISENYNVLKENGYLIRNERGTDAQHVFIDHDVNGPAYFAYYDATNPKAADFVWQTVKRNYYAAGVKLWWLDNDEPDINPWAPENLHFHLGNGLEVANIYPLMHQKAFDEGMQAAGEHDFVTLSRSGWAGSQQYQSVIWSGDIASTFDALAAQVKAGLNMAMSGISWWTTDIGGFHEGDIRSEYFRELVVRWFQYGVFCPVTRLHGYRQPYSGPLPLSGADNEVWSFGDEAYRIITGLLALRENLRPYIQAQVEIMCQTGLPLMRPLLVDFPADTRCEDIEDEYMFGSELLVAPVLEAGVTQRQVYLPVGARWTDAWTGETLEGGQTIMVDAPLDKIPLFTRDGTKLPILPG